jgi:hypothetical protein
MNKDVEKLTMEQKLSRSYLKYGVLLPGKKYRSNFPEINKKFVIIADGHEYSAYIDSQGRINVRIWFKIKGKNVKPGDVIRLYEIEPMRKYSLEHHPVLSDGETTDIETEYIQKNKIIHFTEYCDISNDDIEKLKFLVKTISNQINENPDLDSKLELRKKFIGPLGEAIGLIGIYENVKESFKYKWYGRRKKGFDIILLRDGKEIKIQVKASAEKNYSFSVKTGGLDRKLTEDIKAKKYNIIFQKIDEAIENENADIWLFIHIKDKENIFYLVEKNILKEIVKEDYKKYLNRKHREDTHFGIAESNSIRFIIKQEENYNPFGMYKDNWKLLE